MLLFLYKKQKRWWKQKCVFCLPGSQGKPCGLCPSTPISYDIRRQRSCPSDPPTLAPAEGRHSSSPVWTSIYYWASTYLSFYWPSFPLHYSKSLWLEHLVVIDSPRSISCLHQGPSWAVWYRPTIPACGSSEAGRSWVQGWFQIHVETSLGCMRFVLKNKQIYIKWGKNTKKNFFLRKPVKTRKRSTVVIFCEINIFFSFIHILKFLSVFVISIVFVFYPIMMTQLIIISMFCVIYCCLWAGF